MSDSKHAPTPWQWIDTGILTDAQGDEVDTCCLYDEADAAFIIRAVNAHDELVAALHGLLHIADALEESHEPLSDDGANCCMACDTRMAARSALAKVECSR